MIKRQISFNEEQHRYTDEDNNVYTSVTTLIGKYVPPFNTDYWSKFKANQNNLTQQQVLDNWKDITDKACIKGTVEHKLLENSINESKITPTVIVSQLKESLFVTALNKLTGHEFTNVNIDILAQSNLTKKYPEIFEYFKVKIFEGYKLYVEKRTYSYEHLIAGTIDCLLVKGKNFIIVDWKTNKDSLKFKSGYYKKVNGIKTNQWVDKEEYMLSPINHLQNCKGNVYTLQLSLYAYILELWGLTCIGLILYHLKTEISIDWKGEAINKIVPIQYKINYDKSSAQLLLIDHKNGLTKSKNINNINSNTNLFGIS